MSRGSLEGWSVIERAMELAKLGESFVMATVVWRQGPSSGQMSSRAIVTEAGEIHGWIGGACAEPVIIREAQRVLEEGQPKLIWLGQADEFNGVHVPNGVVTIPISCQSDGALQIYIEPMQFAPKLVIIGRSPMALTLTTLAEDIDWNVELVDGNDFTSSMVTPTTIVIVATQGHGDEEVIEKALVNAPGYLGVVASRRRGELILDYLANRGLAKDVLERVRVPVGLDLGHTSHREVAVSILAELVQLRASSKLANTVATASSAVAPVEILDRVCGMIVKAEISNYPFEYEGNTYYFCCAGCRTSFEKDPVSYLAQEATC
ncbi:MAG TPA: XdhC family protein [Candidatus Nanopelagicaceae bacterium]|nr:XdhC family protein [Candidatus Nanopelagicaceae bacterium]